jgi:hypothetical protein
MTDEWPYPDLQLKTPNCPYCGAAARIMVGANIRPMAWCPTDDCDAVTWDPTVAAAQLIQEARPMEIRSTPLSGVFVCQNCGETRSELDRVLEMDVPVCVSCADATV